MFNPIKQITSKDNDEKLLGLKQKLCKTIEVSFFSNAFPEVVDIRLVNIEIDTKISINYDSDGDLERTDEQIPVSLHLIKKPYYEDETKPIKLILYFENGETIFNNGAKFLISFNDNNETVTFVYVFKSGEWQIIEDCVFIEASTEYVKYKLINCEWKQTDENLCCD